MHTIETARLLMRPFTLDDAGDYYHAIMSDPDVQRYLPGGQPIPRERAEPMLQHFLDHWTRHQFGAWAVILKADNKLIGQCGLQYVPERPEVEVFYAFAKACWGQGFAPEAARAALRFGFETLKLERIIALFAPDNKASERVMIKIGMESQGTLQAYNTELPCYAMKREQFFPGFMPYKVTGFFVGKG